MLSSSYSERIWRCLPAFMRRAGTDSGYDLACTLVGWNQEDAPWVRVLNCGKRTAQALCRIVITDADGVEVYRWDRTDAHALVVGDVRVMTGPGVPALEPGVYTLTGVAVLVGAEDDDPDNDTYSVRVEVAE